MSRIIDGLSTSLIDVTSSASDAQVCANCGLPAARKYCGTSCYRMWQRSRPVEVRFWSKVHKLTTHDGCWLWTSNTVGGNRSKIPYGQFSLLGPDGARLWVYAHRFAWELTYGPIPDGFEILHQCDRPTCVRLDHLRIGTHAENIRDASVKGRLNVPHPNHALDKITTNQAEQIRALYAGGLSQSRIATMFGVSQSWVSRVARNLARATDIEKAS